MEQTNQNLKLVTEALRDLVAWADIPHAPIEVPPSHPLHRAREALKAVGVTL